MKNIVVDRFASFLLYDSLIGVVVTIAGSGSTAFVDGVGTNAGFFHPCGLFLTTTGDLFITDSSHHAIRKMNSAGISHKFQYSYSAFYDALIL